MATLINLGSGAGSTNGDTLFQAFTKVNTNYSNYGGLAPQVQKKEFCKEHNEEVTYFCFECMNKCICSECVVHGVHKNHDVMNIKKAYPIVVEKVKNK